MELKKMFPGALDLTNDEYHGDKTRISKSGITLIRKSPAHYFAEHLDANNPDKTEDEERSKALIIGSAAHCAVFEPHLFAHDYVLTPGDAPKRPTKAQVNAKKPSADTIEAIDFWTKFDADNAGKTMLKNEEYELVKRMADAVWRHPAAYELVSDGYAEQSFHFNDPETGVACKVRPDFIAEELRMLPDLKTTEDASPEGFVRSIAKYTYDIQDPFYIDGVEAATGQRFDRMVFIAVEKKYPHVVECYYISDDDVRIGREMYSEGLYTYRECQKTGHWPGYSGIITPLRVPRFKRL